jgi:hypothetical protein
VEGGGWKDFAGDSMFVKFLWIITYRYFLSENGEWQMSGGFV